MAVSIMHRHLYMKFFLIGTLSIIALSVLAQGGDEQTSVREFEITSTSIGWISLYNSLEQSAAIYNDNGRYIVKEEKNNLYRVYLKRDAEPLLEFHGKNVDSARDIKAPVRSIYTSSPKFATVDGVKVGLTIPQLTKIIGPFNIGISEDDGTEYVESKSWPTVQVIELAGGLKRRIDFLINLGLSRMSLEWGCKEMKSGTANFTDEVKQ